METTKMKRRILYISGTRADYGPMVCVLKRLNNSSFIDLKIVATGMHLMPEFGLTINEIKKDGFNFEIIDATYEKDNEESMANFIGVFIQKFSKKIKDYKPDIILVSGDRAEMLAGAIVGAYLTIPVAHIHGGDISSTIDEHVRHAITKLAQVHFPATKKSAERLIRMSEEKWRIHIVGSPAIDAILNEKTIKPNMIATRFNLDLSEPIAIMVQHPVTIEIDAAAKQIRNTLDAIVELECQTILIYPNADAGGREMIKVIKEFERYPFVKLFKNLTRKEYLSLLKIGNVMVGNSSSGIIEAPSFNLPVVNIGTRQEGRERAENFFIDVGYDKKEIVNAIKKALHDDEFRENVKNSNNIYGDGNANVHITTILENLRINKTLLQKRMT